MTTVILVRHGQSMANLEGRFAGQAYDAELSPLGHKQAECTAKYIADTYKINKIYASDLKRAFQTAEHTAKLLDMEVIPESGMREIFAGKWEGMKFEDIDTEYAEEYKIWKTNIGVAGCKDGETVSELCERVSKTITKIASENDGKTVMVATHATPIRVLETLWKGKSLEEMKDFPWVTNASVTVAEYENGKFKLISVGEDEHLSEMRTALPKNV